MRARLGCGNAPLSPAWVASNPEAGSLLQRWAFLCRLRPLARRGKGFRPGFRRTLISLYALRNSRRLRLGGPWSGRAGEGRGGSHPPLFLREVRVNQDQVFVCPAAAQKDKPVE